MCLLRESDYWVAHLGHPIFSFNLGSVILLTLSQHDLFWGCPFGHPQLYALHIGVAQSGDPILTCFMLGVANLPPPIYSNPAISPGLMPGLIGVIGSDDSSFTWVYVRVGRFAHPKYINRIGKDKDRGPPEAPYLYPFHVGLAQSGDPRLDYLR